MRENSRHARTSVTSEGGPESPVPHTETEYQRMLRASEHGEPLVGKSDGGHTQAWEIEEDPSNLRRWSAAPTYASNAGTLVNRDPEQDPAYEEQFDSFGNAIAARRHYTAGWN